MIKLLMTAIVVAVLGGCSAHMTLLALDKEQSNQQQYIDEYEAEMAEMEADDVR